jgi:hypothetical protein
MMRENTRQLISGLAFLAVMVLATAATAMTVADLPQAFLEKYQVTNIAPVLNAPEKEMARIFGTDAQGAGVDFLLARYSLFSPSGHTWDDYQSPESSSQTPYTGSVWLQASSEYSMADAWHDFSLYTEDVLPGFYGWPGGSEISLQMTSEALLAGGGEYHVSWDYENNVIEEGNLRLMDGGLMPLDSDIDLFFNLIYGKYQTNAGSGSYVADLNLADSRSVLFDYRLTSYDYGTTDLLAVQAVPLPPAICLLAAFLPLLPCLSRKRQKS